MKQKANKPNLSARTAALILALMVSYAADAASQTKDDLAVTNGDFSDLSDLGDADGNGWRHGIPFGWTSTPMDPSNPVDPMYTVNVRNGPTPPVCNVLQLGFLQQEVGFLNDSSDVVLEFDVLQLWGGDASLGAAILGPKNNPLAVKEFFPGERALLVAPAVPSGTDITIQFWAANGTTPGLDNVTVKTFAPGKAPEAARKPESP